MADTFSDQNKYDTDSRIPCKYGVKCYQKNPTHHEKYKHPPRKKTVEVVKHTVKKLKIDTKDKKTQKIATALSDSDYSIEDDSDNDTSVNTKTKVSNDVSDSDNSSIDDDFKRSAEKTSNTNVNTKTKVTNDVSDSDNSNIDDDFKKSEEKIGNTSRNISNDISDSDSSATDNGENKPTKEIVPIQENNDIEKDTPAVFDHRKFIKEKFLVDMPEDFYQFWEFCKKLKASKPLEALNDIGLLLVGPFDVLAGRFNNVKKPGEQYLIHWRYYHDPPEFQTVLKGDDNVGFHIGYFRDSPEEAPVFLAGNSAKRDGILRQMGGNIFAAVNIYLDELKKTGDPFKKMNIGRIQSSIKKGAENLKINLSVRTDAIVARDKKIVTRTFNKIGLVVPYNRKTQLGYRELALGNKDLATLLTKLQKALPEQESKFLSELQPVFTYATIAADECDFGTGIELGWNIIAHGVESLNSTALRFLTSNYSLLNREVFGTIATAHLKNRKRSCSLSIL